MPDSLDNIVESHEAERLATGFEFTEGPLWHPDGYLLFVNNRRFRPTAPGATPITATRYFTARSSVYRMRMKTTGINPWRGD